jgi:hypothetical protein
MYGETKVWKKRRSEEDIINEQYEETEYER